MPNVPHDQQLTVSHDEGSVFVEGGPGIALTLTPRAAADTSDAMLKHAVEAEGEEIIAGITKQERDRTVQSHP